MTEETYPPKAYRPKHGRLSELKAEALKKDRRKKLTLAKFVGMAENTAHPRVVIPELRQEFELVGAFAFPPRAPAGRGLWEGFDPWGAGAGGGGQGTRGHLQLKACCGALPSSCSTFSLFAGPLPQAHGGIPAGAQEQPEDGPPRRPSPQLRPERLLQEEAGKKSPTEGCFPPREGPLPWMERMEDSCLLAWWGGCCEHLQACWVVGGLADGSKCCLA